MKKEVIVALIWWAVATLTSIGCISWAMFWGWGLEPRSWFNIIVAYFFLQIAWSVTVWCKIKLLKRLGIKGEGAH